MCGCLLCIWIFFFYLFRGIACWTTLCEEWIYLPFKRAKKPYSESWRFTISLSGIYICTHLHNINVKSHAISAVSKFHFQNQHIWMNLSSSDAVLLDVDTLACFRTGLWWDLTFPWFKTKYISFNTKGDILQQVQKVNILYMDLFICVLAIYLAKKNIRKQGELIEYEKVCRSNACHTIEKQDCTIVTKPSVVHFSISIFVRSAIVLYINVSTTPGTLLWCRQESSSGNYPFPLLNVLTHTRTHTHTHTHTLTHAHTHTHTQRETDTHTHTHTHTHNHENK